MKHLDIILIYNHKSLLETKKVCKMGIFQERMVILNDVKLYVLNFRETSGPALENNGFCHPIVNLKSRNTMHSGIG
jgi:hypothetical protein